MSRRAIEEEIGERPVPSSQCPMQRKSQISSLSQDDGTSSLSPLKDIDSKLASPEISAALFQSAISFIPLSSNSFEDSDIDLQAPEKLLLKSGHSIDRPIDLTVDDDHLLEAPRKKRRLTRASLSRSISQTRSRVEDLSIQNEGNAAVEKPSYHIHWHGQAHLALPENSTSGFIENSATGMRQKAPDSDFRNLTEREIQEWIPADSICSQDLVISSGSQVQLRYGQGRHFLEVTSVGQLKGRSGTFIIGRRFDSLDRLGISAAGNYNELCLVQTIADGRRPMVNRTSLFIAPAAQILRVVSILLTNEPRECHPKNNMELVDQSNWICRTRRAATSLQNEVDDNESGHENAEANFWKVDNDSHGAVAFLSFNDCHERGDGRIVPDSVVRSEFRGECARGGSTRNVTIDEQNRYRKEHETAELVKQKLGHEYNRGGIWVDEERRRAEKSTEHHVRWEFGDSMLRTDKTSEKSISEKEVIEADALSGHTIPHTTSLNYNRSSTLGRDITHRGAALLDDLDKRSTPSPFAQISCIYGDGAPSLGHPLRRTFEPSVTWVKTLPGTRHNWQRQHNPASHMDDSVPPSQRYTYGDAFCGAGGMTRGVVEAGACPIWAFDIEKRMCDVYKSNFPWVKVANMDAFDFINDETMDYKVDLLHISPPCKFYSPAHTINCDNDDANIAASFAIASLLAKAKPRIVTLEQTVGLTYPKHQTFFRAIIREFILCGYSVRWKTMLMADYGVPQSRKRLIVLASCPGEALPPFPAPTHYDPRSVEKPRDSRPWNFISNAIDGTIPPDHPHHNIAAAPKARGERFEPFDGTTRLARTLTCKGGNNNHHPSGERLYSVQELAMLQTFPIWHTFTPPEERANGRMNDHVVSTKIQIGNAVPPLFAKTLYEFLIRWLETMDGLQDDQAGLEPCATRSSTDLE